MTDEIEVSKLEDETETLNLNKEEETDLETAIIQQVEFYFSDANIHRDTFLREQINLDDGWVPLDVLITFNRLAKLSVDHEVIATALKKSTTGILEVSEDNKKVRRNPEFPVPELTEEIKQERRSRTVYVNGFPKNSSYEELFTFFKQFGKNELLVMRKYQDKFTKLRLFKGSIFITFLTKEQAENFMKTRDLTYKETPLLILWQDDYLKKRREENKSRKKQLKRQLSEEKYSEIPIKLPTGSVLKFTGASGKTTKEAIKHALTALGAEVAYVEHKLGDTDGFVRLTKLDAAKEIAKKQPDGKIKILDTIIEFQLLDDTEEKDYLDKAADEIRRRRRINFMRYNKEKTFQPKRGQKRQASTDEDAPPQKK